MTHAVEFPTGGELGHLCNSLRFGDALGPLGPLAEYHTVGYCTYARSQFPGRISTGVNVSKRALY